MPNPHDRPLKPRGALPYDNSTEYYIDPSDWETTPAEDDVVLSRPRVVRFAANPVSRMRRVQKWWGDVWTRCEQSRDESTDEDDNAAIAALDECF